MKKEFVIIVAFLCSTFNIEAVRLERTVLENRTLTACKNLTGFKDAESKCASLCHASQVCTLVIKNEATCEVECKREDLTCGGKKFKDLQEECYREVPVGYTAYLKIIENVPCSHVCTYVRNKI